MPSFIIHEAVGKIVNISLKMNDKLFMIGTIMPDCWRNSKKFGYENRLLSHFQLNSRKEDYEAFYEKYKSNIDNPLYMGYLVHLITDAYWRGNVTTNFEKEIDGNMYYINKDGTLTIKSYLYKKENLLKIMPKIIKKFNISKISLDNYHNELNNLYIDELDISGLNDSVNFTNNLIDIAEEGDSILYDFDKINYWIEETSNYVLREIQRLKKIK